MTHQLSFKLKGLTCEACQKLTSRRIQRIPGVHAVTVDLASGIASLTADRNIARTEIQSSLEGTHYTVEESTT